MRAWYQEALAADWKGPADIKAKYRNASIVADNRVVFNIAGNKYRLVVHVKYDSKIVMIKFIGTHEEYGDMNVNLVDGGKK